MYERSSLEDEREGTEGVKIFLSKVSSLTKGEGRS